MKVLIALFLVLVSMLYSNAYGQNSGQEHEEHKHHIGFHVGSVYNTTEEKNMLGLGLEYEYILPFWNNILGVGLASEMVFDEHRHYVFSILVPFHPTRQFTLFVASGIMFIDKEQLESRFAVHFGVEYEFDLEKLFFAPKLEVAFAGDDVHLMLGVHIGFGF